MHIILSFLSFAYYLCIFLFTDRCKYAEGLQRNMRGIKVQDFANIMIFLFNLFQIFAYLLFLNVYHSLLYYKFNEKDPLTRYH